MGKETTLPFKKSISASVLITLVCLAAWSSFQSLPAGKAIVHILLLGVVIQIAWSDFSEMKIHILSLAACMLLGLLFAGLVAPTVDGDFFASYDSVTAFLRGVIALLIFWSIHFLYKIYRKQTGMGLADIILFGVAAIWLPPERYAHFVLVACLGAISFVVIRYLAGKETITGTQRVPFGAFLGISVWLTVLVSNF